MENQVKTKKKRNQKCGGQLTKMVKKKSCGTRPKGRIMSQKMEKGMGNRKCSIG